MKDIKRELEESLQRDIEQLNKRFSEILNKLKLMDKRIQELEKDKKEILEIYRKVINIVSSYSKSNDFDLIILKKKIKEIENEVENIKTEMKGIIQDEKAYINSLLENTGIQILENEILSYKEKLESYEKKFTKLGD